MTWVAAGAAGAGLIGSIGGMASSSRANKKAERARARAFADSSARVGNAYDEAAGALAPAYESAITQRKDVSGAMGEQAEQTYAAQKELWAPWMIPGMDAFKQMDTLLNDPNGYSASFNQYANSPQFKFKMDEATKAMRRQASAAGNRFGGAQMAALGDRAEQVAGQEFNGWLDRLQTMANTGFQATGHLGNAQSQLGTQKLGALQYGDTSAFDIDKAQQMNALTLGKAQDISNLQMGSAASASNAALAKGQLQTNLLNQLTGLGGMMMTGGGGGGGTGALSSGFGTINNNTLNQAEGFTGGALSGGMRVS